MMATYESSWLKLKLLEWLMKAGVWVSVIASYFWVSIMDFIYF